MPVDEIREWAVQVLKRLADRYDLDNDEFIILAGDKYRKFIIPQLKHWEAPLKGLRIGQQLAWYIKHTVKAIKEAFNKFIRFIIG